MEEQKDKKLKKTWVKVLRAVIWGIVLIFCPVGMILVRAASSSKVIAEDVTKLLMGWGVGIMIVSLILLSWNFVWGAVRWAEKWYDGKWKVFGGMMRTMWAGLWRVAVFAAIIAVSMLIIVPRIEDGIVASYTAQKEKEWLTGQVGIEADLQQGNISPDEYLRYMLAVGYGTEELPKKYRTDQAAMMPDIMRIIEEYGERMSQETLEMAFDALYQTNIEVGLDASGNVAKSRNHGIGKMVDGILGAKTVQAYTKEATTLNKAVLSNKENFIVYYTDVGDDAISDDQAKQLADMMEKIVANYQDKLGLEYSFTFHELSKSNTKKMQEVLRNSGIDEEKYKTAMAAYVANPYSEETNTLAFYMGEHLAEWGNKVLMNLGKLFGIDEARWTKSMLGVPNITILSSNLDDPSLELVTAHELGHHYQNLHCQGELGKQCPASDMAVEGGANWLALNVVEEQPDENVIQGHYNTYVKFGTCYEADEILNEPPEKDACHNSGSFMGYPALAFLQNYYESVDGATEKLMDALLQEDELTYLLDQATNEEMQEVMRKLSRRNVMGGYTNINLETDAVPKTTEIDCGSELMCELEMPLRSTAVKYVYVATEEHDRAKVTISGTEDDVISVLGKKGNEWILLKEGVQEVDYVAEKQGEYEAIMFAVANAGRNYDQVKVNIEEEEIAEIIEETTEDATEEKSNGCTVIDFQGLMDDVLSIGKSTTELIGMLGGETDGFEDFEQGVAEAKKEMQGKRLEVCELQVKDGITLDSVEERLRRTLWMSWRVLTIKESGTEVRVLAGVDRTRTRGKIMMLGEDGGRMYILEMRVEEE